MSTLTVDAGVLAVQKPAQQGHEQMVRLLLASEQAPMRRIWKVKATGMGDSGSLPVNGAAIAN